MMTGIHMIVDPVERVAAAGCALRPACPPPGGPAGEDRRSVRTVDTRDITLTWPYVTLYCPYPLYMDTPLSLCANIKWCPWCPRRVTPGKIQPTALRRALPVGGHCGHHLKLILKRRGYPYPCLLLGRHPSDRFYARVRSTTAPAHELQAFNTSLSNGSVSQADSSRLHPQTAKSRLHDTQ